MPKQLHFFILFTLFLCANSIAQNTNVKSDSNRISIHLREYVKKYKKDTVELFIYTDSNKYEKKYYILNDESKYHYEIISYDDTTIENKGLQYRFKNGKLNSFSYYKNDSTNYKVFGFDGNGKLDILMQNMGQGPDGQKLLFYSNGNVKKISSYKSIKDWSVYQVGSYIEFYENGSIKVSGQYKLEKVKSGSVQREGSFIDSDKLTKFHYESKKTGIWYYYTENGQLEETKIYD